MDTPPFEAPNGWNQWSKYVLKELERLNLCYRELNEKVDMVNTKLTMVQVKVAGIGAIASLITTLVVLLLANVLTKK